MSPSGKSNLEDQFRNALTCQSNKKDTKEIDLGSPVSPLRTRDSRSGPIPASTTSSSSSSSGSISGKMGSTPDPKITSRLRNNHSGELSGSSDGSPTRAETGGRSGGGTKGTKNPNYKPDHHRSGSGNVPLVYSGGGGGSGGSSGSVGTGSGSGGSGLGSVSSPMLNALPAGNICPSGKILKSKETTNRSDVLGMGTGNYGHGSIMRGGVGAAKPGGVETGEAMVKRAMVSSDPEVLKKAGNEQYKKSNFAEALRLYDRAIAISPDSAICRSNRAAALTGLGRLTEAVRECEEAVRLDPGYGRAHHRLACLHLRLGNVENARTHFCYSGQQPDPADLKKLDMVESHLSRCVTAWKIGDWRSTLREGDAAIAAGAESSPQLFACRTEALLKLHQLSDAESSLARIPTFGSYPPSCSQAKFVGMFSEAYVYYVRAQVEMAFGRFENAATAAEKAGQLDPRNVEVSTLLNKVRMVARARARGNDLFKSGMFSEACSAYGEGLKFDPSNSVLYCNRAVCWSKLGKWERSVEDCSQALMIQPNYTKALHRRAASNTMLERWVESVRDYEVLRRALPDNKEVAEALFHAQVALKKSRGEEVHNLKFGGEVEEVSEIDQFRAAISSPGISVVHFKAASNQQCEHITPFVDMLCIRYPSVKFLKVDVEKSSIIAKAENVSVVPTFKIYKNGSRVREMICPDRQVLEHSVKHYCI